MNNTNKPWNIHETVSSAKRVACNKYGLDSTNSSFHFKDDLRVRKEVNNIMTPLLRGRPFPVKNPKMQVNNEASRMFNKSLFYGCYPKKLTNSKEKIKWLEEKLNEKSITAQVFIDLVEVLNDKKGGNFERNGIRGDNISRPMCELQVADNKFGFL